MADSRLNSIHLDPARKLGFRLARQMLLGAHGGSRGDQTLPSTKDGPDRIFDADSSATPGASGVPPAVPKLMLMDRDDVYPLKAGLNTIGRMPDNDVVLADPYVSRRHCAVLVHAADRCELHDIASKNGTFINGRKIEGPTPLNSGDQIDMCGKHLVFVSRGEDFQGVTGRTVCMD